MAEIVKLANTLNDSAVKYAEEILERCKSGEFIELTVIGFRGDGTFITGGSTTQHSLKTIGGLMSAILDLNKASQKDE
jgi:hypothetical protein